MPGSSTNRGGKRANGPAGVGRNAQSGGSIDHGRNFRNPHHTGAQYQSHQPQQQQQPASVSRQGVGPADSNQHPPTSNAQQSELKQGTPAAQSPNSFSGSRASGTGGASVQPSNSVTSGAAAKPPPPVVPSASAAIPELALPVPTGPGAAGNASEQPHAALLTNQNANIQGPKSGARTPVVEPPPATKPQGMAQQPMQFSQGQGHSVAVEGHVSQHSHAPIHIPATVQSQHFQHIQLVQAQAQAHQAQAQAQAQVQQAHAQQQHQQQTHQQQPHQQTPHQQQSQQQPPQKQQQQQVLAQQALPQQALVQQSLSQGMKYPQPMMPPHGSQIISQQMGSPLAGQPQMAHQLGPPMGGAMGGQLPPGISGAQYGPPQNRPVTYSSPHHAIPSYYQQLQGGAYGQAPFYVHNMDNL